MSRHDHNSQTSEPIASRASGSARSSQDQLAHELANLLDGSLRNISLVMSSLRDVESVEHEPTGYGQEPDLLPRLQSVNQGLKQMAQLVHRWMDQHRHVGALYRDSRTLGQMIDHALRLMYPAAKMRGIELVTQVDESAAQLPAGPVYPIIANALRNSIESIASSPPPAGGGKVELAVLVRQGRVCLTISDNGSGLDPNLVNSSGDFQVGRTTKPDGHGLGLALCQQIADTLGGQLHLSNLPSGGARLTLDYPRSSLDESPDSSTTNFRDPRTR